MMVKPICKVEKTLDKNMVLLSATIIDDEEREESAVVLGRILNHGKEYFTYEQGEIVYALWDGGSASKELVRYFYDDVKRYDNFQGIMMYVVGSFYHENNEPPETYEKVRGLYFDKNNYIEINMEEKTLDIKFEGAIYINGGEVYLNG